MYDTDKEGQNLLTRTRIMTERQDAFEKALSDLLDRTRELERIVGCSRAEQAAGPAW